MTLAPPKPSTFKRSTERKVTDPNEAITIAADRRVQVELQRFEDRALSGAVDPSLARFAEPEDRKVEALYDEMLGVAR